MTRKSNGKKSRARQRQNGGDKVSTTRAPTMNGMQQVDTWTIYDFVPVVIDPNASVDRTLPVNL
jgi:glycyl-tRNA synthetase (class II)